MSRILLSLFACLALVPTIFGALQYGFPYGEEKIRGVNLGGWLVLESFTTPSLFDRTGDVRVVDEYTFGQFVPKVRASELLKEHWDTFITEKDFEDIAAAGLNHVRIPIGHWMFELSSEDPYYQGQLPYLLKAVEWARKYRIQVIVALYGAPSSQNGFINSGHFRDAAYWHKNQTSVDRTVNVMKTLTAMFEDQTDIVSIIQVMNEPAGFRKAILNPELLEVLKKYYYDSYNFIRNPLGGKKKSNFIVMLHDAFQHLSYWNNFMPNNTYDGVMMDTHIYQMFNDHASLYFLHIDAHMTDDEHIQRACTNATIMSKSPMNTIIGEWTATNNDCGPHLLGRFMGQRYDGTLPGTNRVGSCIGRTGKASTFSDEYKEFMRKYWEAQTQSYEKGGQGWIMWTWKMENADEWSYKAGVENGWIPQDPTDYKYPNICG
ncbi:hypothetical protein CVT25_008433 [Psilocybe cyanescens]|uniref:Glycoside hydrolase family 5 domain-containing protein n=1 Tax=Psilocybe cyanescens TaxID=93625 RepID=A0A409WUT1_PSICY|nr:hypothetical protein CVT25_008433 [Psilocybe cyanescens]